MTNRIQRTLAALALGLAVVIGSFVVLSAPASAQGLDLCALLGDPYCPPGVDPGDTVRDPDGNVEPTLARTGSDTGSLAGIGVGLVAVGFAAAYSARRRAESSSAS